MTFMRAPDDYVHFATAARVQNLNPPFSAFKVPHYFRVSLQLRVISYARSLLLVASLLVKQDLHLCHSVNMTRIFRFDWKLVHSQEFLVLVVAFLDASILSDKSEKCFLPAKLHIGVGLLVENVETDL